VRNCVVAVRDDDAAGPRDPPPRDDELAGLVLLGEPRHVLAHQSVHFVERLDVREQQDEHGRHGTRGRSGARADRAAQARAVIGRHHAA
jgi:hypothetical protein